MSTRRPERAGFSLVEALVAMGILAAVILGLIAGAEVASNGNAYSRRRSLMLQFAQSRMELIMAMTRSKVPTSTTTYPVNCSAMAYSTWPFNPLSAPGTGGWMIDVIDGAPPPGAGTLGDDMMFGPLLIEGDRTAVDRTDTLTQRTTLYNNWIAGSAPLGCGDPIVTKNPDALCREIHIEPYDLTIGTTVTHMFTVYVRVVAAAGRGRTTTSWSKGMSPNEPATPTARLHHRRADGLGHHRPRGDHGRDISLHRHQQLSASDADDLRHAGSCAAGARRPGVGPPHGRARVWLRPAGYRARRRDRRRRIPAMFLGPNVTITEPGGQTIITNSIFIAMSNATTISIPFSNTGTQGVVVAATATTPLQIQCGNWPGPTSTAGP